MSHAPTEPQTIYIYWDYENCPIPNQSSVAKCVDVIKQRIFQSLGQKLQCEIKLYISSDKLKKKIQRDMEICGIKHFEVPSLKPEAVDKRMLVDLALDLYQWKGVNCNVVVLISGDQDFGNILGRIHGVKEISKLILLRLPNSNGIYNNVNPNLLHNVDEVIQDFILTQFTNCPHGQNCNNIGDCKYYHLRSHFNHKYQIQSPPSSISNMSIFNGSVYDMNEEETKYEYDEVLAARGRTPCRYGDKCRYWKAGNCQFYHAVPYNSSSPSPSPYPEMSPSPQPMFSASVPINQTEKRVCPYGEDCKWNKIGQCWNYHPAPQYNNDNQMESLQLLKQKLNGIQKKYKQMPSSSNPDNMTNNMKQKPYQQPISKSISWACAICTFENPTNAVCCQLCTARKIEKKR